MEETKTPKLKKLWGRFEHSLDDKGRLLLPSRFGVSPKDEFVIMAVPNPQKHLWLYESTTWETLNNELASDTLFDQFDHSLQSLQRFFGNCDFVEVDSSGRITLPRTYRTWAGLMPKGEETITPITIGLGNRIEIWNRESWDAYMETFNAQTLVNATNALAQRQAGVVPPQVGIC